ncbi:BMP family lipoprotein [[Clostridium] colinum]|uniref:BMP family lipoprotein n=1 Tax=[Clostridium] colinum TaxID=36835 RepID=UPI0020251A92|nr:BMP family ABC transporter substrate-binding protein [[Clostridium] colinum]
MKRVVSLILAVTMALGMVACGNSSNEKNSTQENTSSAEIALVTDVGTIDDKSFNQGSWEGVVKFAEEKGITHKYYQPSEKSNEAIITAIELAIKGGAKTVVCPGFLFEVPVYNMQKKYPDIKFILIDGVPQDGGGELYELADNTQSIYFAEEQAGFLAGYASVIEGFRNLGFMGGIAVPAVIRYGYGFVQGAEYAGKELGLAPGEITMNYTYVGDFDASPDHTAKAAAWYNEGVEVIFACGGGVGNSVMKAAETAGKKVIGVDVDQSFESETVITSAMKNLQNAIYKSLQSIYDGTFSGGNVIDLGANTQDILLPMETSKFEVFSQEQYDLIYSKIANEEIKLKNETAGEKPTDLGSQIVTVNFK